jgi:LysM domain
MSAPTGRRVAESPTCPLLGLLGDEASRFSYSSVGHRCYADGRLRTIDLSHQGSFCLVATYPECPRYRAATASRRPGAATPEASGIAPGRVRAEAGIPGAPGTLGASGVPEGPGASGEPGRQRPGRTSRWLRIAAVVIAVAVLAGAAYLGSPAIVDWVRQVGSGTGPASTSPSTPPPATRTPTATHAPTATPTPKRTATPLVHVVVKGETLNAIATRYGVTLTALEKANGIKDPNLIHVGQRLIIPAP